MFKLGVYKSAINGIIFHFNLEFYVYKVELLNQFPLLYSLFYIVHDQTHPQTTVLPFCVPGLGLVPVLIQATGSPVSPIPTLVCFVLLTSVTWFLFLSTWLWNVVT